MKNLHFKMDKETCTEKTWIKYTRWAPFMRFVSWILIISLLNLTGGCMNYFKVRKPSGSSIDNLKSFQTQNKTIIIHIDDNAWFLENPEISASQDTLYAFATKQYIPKLKNPIKPEKTNRYRKKDKYNEEYVLNEVHIYVSELTKLEELKVAIPLSTFQKIEVYEKDKAATVGSWTLGILGTTAGIWAVLAIILILTKSSCPFIYIFDGDNYKLAGEIYSGSIQPSLERHDFLKLPEYCSTSSTYQLKIANEVKEIQHTNLMELWVFDHNEKTEIGVDKYGNYYTLPKLLQPLSAKNLKGTDVIDLIQNKDSLNYTSLEINGEMPITDGIIFEFPNPQKTNEAKLSIRAKNSFVLDYMLGQFQNQFGDLYTPWMKQQRKAPKKQLQEWSFNQNIPLTLSVEKNGKWEKMDYFNVAGPMALKDDILAIPLDGSESNPLKVKLEFGNFFWEIDYVGIDYSIPSPVNYEIVPINTAIDQNGKDVSKKMEKDDERYYIQPNVGDYALVDFELPTLTNENRTIILHSKGWYHILRNPEGQADREYLETFRQPGRFNQFVNDYLQNLTSK